ncbi:MAG: substrate-binding domain-containing protein [Treponema sp.]|nr:substrate-binding domain-containing protein [Treponema sp.]
MKKIVFLITATVLILLNSGCSRKNGNFGSSDSGEKSQQKLIGLSIDTLAIERWRRDCDVFLNTVKGMGYDVIVQNAKNSVDEQRRQIEYLVNKNVGAIVILPKNSDAFEEQVKLCHSKNIPVISYDRLIRNCDVDLYLTIDSQKVGERMARGLLKNNSYGTWYCIYGPEEDFNMAMIHEGLTKTLSQTQVRIGYVAHVEGWNYDLAYNEMNGILNSGKLPNAVVCGNDALANSVIQALEEHNLKQKVFVAGQDADILNCQHIVNGKQTLTVYKPITELAKLAGVCAVELAGGKKVTEIPSVSSIINNGYMDVPAVMLDPVTVTKNNIDDVIIKSGFHTYEEVYQR